MRLKVWMHHLFVDSFVLPIQLFSLSTANTAAGLTGARFTGTADAFAAGWWVYGDLLIRKL
jgi:hypothetical protein